MNQLKLPDAFEMKVISAGATGAKHIRHDNIAIGMNLKNVENNVQSLKDMQSKAKSETLLTV